MKKALIGAGGFANEIRAHIGEKLKCFVDDEYYVVNTNEIYPISEFDPEKFEVIVAVGDPTLRKKIVERLPKNTKFFTYIDSSAKILDSNIEIGEGSMICSGVIVTTNCKIGKHTHLNLQTTVGHDCIIGNYFTTAPGAKISGNCTIGDCVYVGTNASIKQKISICDDVTIGLNAGVVKNISEKGTYIGSPVRKLEK